MYPDPSRVVFGHKSLCYLEKDMARYLSKDGVLPLLIPDLEEQRLLEFLSDMDGIVLQGGSDLAPESYGETPIDPKKWPGDRYRDLYEFKIVDFAIKNHIPLYGICRGFQVINCFLGGSLYQDLPSQIESTTLHRDAEKYDHIKHRVKVIPGTHLEKMYAGKKVLDVNTVHHQGVKTLGQNLEIEALSTEDDIIEAFTRIDDQSYILGVQWHPEFSHTIGDQLDNPDLLLEHFYERVKEQKCK
jgi:putative glutamine amidotransferase